MIAQLTNKYFGTTLSGQSVTEFTLTNSNGLEMKVINYGCTITSLSVPDRHGVLDDIVLGFDALEGYLNSNHYIGCIVGRYANRIANGKFVLEGKEYILVTNLPPNHLHGGLNGFGRVVWTAEEISDEHGVGVLFRHTSPHGDEGYPGNLTVEVKYVLGDDNTLSFEYYAMTDQQTIINLTQHSYFNLNGGKENILDHQLTIHADYFLPVDETMIPTGEKKRLENTPFDFRAPKLVGLDITGEDHQLGLAHGYDHTWVINRSGETLQYAATLYDAVSGRKMEVYTTEPGIQLYTGNFLEGSIPGKNNIRYGARSGLCLETQHFPDSPNQRGFPSAVLKPGEQYNSKTLLRFSTTTQS